MTKYTWDYENRLTNVQMHQGKFVSYEYDGDGNRIGKISGVKKPLMKEKLNQEKVNKQQAEIIYKAASNGNGNDNNGNNGNGNGNNGNGNNRNGNGNGNGKDQDKVKNKDLPKEERNKKKEEAKQGKGYKQKGKNTNRGKHLGWYKNKYKNEDKLEQQIEETYYLNDVSSDLSQVMMTYDDTGMFDTAYTYGVERIGIDILDGTRPDAQNPLYYLYDGQGSVTYVTKPDGEKRDTYTYDEFGKPRTGKLSPDGDKVLHNSFGYNGEQWDEESNLQYLRARYYEPETGRFLSRDTYQGELQNPLSKHLYAYVQNNPVNNIDPSGHNVMAVGSLSSALPGIIAGITASIASIETAIATSWLPGVAIAATAVAVTGIVYTYNKVKPLFAAAASTRAAVRAEVANGGVNPKKLGKNTVYVITRKDTTDVVYAGRTVRYENRYRYHQTRAGAKFPKSSYTMMPIATNLTLAQARALEQTIITAYGIDTLYNMINSISPSKWSKFKSEYKQMKTLIQSWKDPE